MMKKLFSVLVCAALLLTYNNITAQKNPTPLASQGDKYFKEKNYDRAAASYEHEAPANPSLYMNMCKSYFAIQDFEKAQEALQLYMEKDPKAEKEYAEKLMALLKREDERVKVENLGPVINTANSEYIPRIFQDGKTLYFLATDRPGGSGGEDIYTSVMDDKGNWQEPKEIKGLNTKSNESMHAISPDDKVAILFGNYPGTFGGGDLFYSVKTDGNWSTPCNLGGRINTKKWQSLACLGPDGKTLIFSTDLEEGNKSDMYVTFLKDTGWTTPLNLGRTINTDKSDNYPFLSADGKTLYFSSSGHFGFGGKDMFVSRRLDDSWTNWSTPVNMGKYINTLDDDADLSIPASGKMAYMVRSDAPDGYGESDVYKFLLPYSMRPEQLFKIYGYVTNEKDSAAEVNIKFIDMATNKEVTNAVSSVANGYYAASVPLNKKYMAVVDMKGYLYYSEIIDLSDPEKYRKKYTFQQKITVQRANLDQIKIKMDSLNLQLDALNKSESEKIRETFEKYERLNKEYKKAIDEMDNLIYTAKYDWMTENIEDLSLQRDFKVRRARIGTTFELKNIFFDPGKSALRDESKKELDKLFEILNNSEITIELGGHTDSIGSDEANQQLSQDRVNSVKTYLVGKGIPDKRLAAVGYGEKVPVASNSTAEGRQMNRRVEVKILKMEADKEGSDVVTEENKKKKAKEPVVIKKGEMLPTLQAAARNGGLPSGSACNTDVVVSTNTYNNPQQQPINNSSRKVRSRDNVDLDGNIYKRFNMSLINHGYQSIGGTSLGGSMIFVNEDNLCENHIEYFFLNPAQVKWGIGYNFRGIIQLSEAINLPVNIILGSDNKMFFRKDSIEGPQIFGNLNVPVGIRVLLPLADNFIVAPEFLYSYGLAKPKILANRASYIEVGGAVRFKFIHGGLYLNLGKEIQRISFRAGLSFGS